MCNITRLFDLLARVPPDDMLQRYVRHDSSIRPSSTCTMGWLRLVGSLQLYDSFAEYRLFYRALLQKRPMILRSLLIVAI